MAARIGDTAAMDNGACHHELDKSVRGKLLLSAMVSQISWSKASKGVLSILAKVRRSGLVYHDHLVDVRHVFFLPLQWTT
jgi:hypothetical protein